MTPDELQQLARDRIGARVTPLERATAPRPAAATAPVSPSLRLPLAPTTPAAPGIDVNSYVGSMWNGTATGPGATQALAAAARFSSPVRQSLGDGGSPSTLLPTGNPGAKLAMLRAQLPNATRSELTAVGNYAYNRPEEFAAGPLGARMQLPNAQLAATRQSTSQSAALFPGQLAGQQASLDATRTGTAATAQSMGAQAQEASRRQTGDAATAAYFMPHEDAAISAAAKAGAPAQVLFDMAQLAEQRKQRDITNERAVPKETTVQGRPAVVSNGNVQFTEPSPKDIYPEPKIITNEHGKFMQSGPNQPWQQVPDSSKFPSPVEWAMAGQPMAAYWPARVEYDKTRKLPAGAAPAGAPPANAKTQAPNAKEPAAKPAAERYKIVEVK